jgi:hypothetical protein
MTYELQMDGKTWVKNPAVPELRALLDSFPDSVITIETETSEACRKVKWRKVPELKTYEVGFIYLFQAEDEDHAVEQWYDAVGGETPDANVVREVGNE